MYCTKSWFMETNFPINENQPFFVSLNKEVLYIIVPFFSFSPIKGKEMTHFYTLMNKTQKVESFFKSMTQQRMVGKCQKDKQMQDNFITLGDSKTKKKKKRKCTSWRRPRKTEETEFVIRFSRKNRERRGEE